MLTTTAGWEVALLCVVLCASFACWRHGISAAVGVGMIVSFLFPVWLAVHPGGLPIDVRTMSAILLLIAFALHPRGQLWSPLTLVDLAVGSLVVLQVGSDLVNSGAGLWIPAWAYGEWAVPYLVGRYAVRDTDDLLKLAPWALGLLALLGILAVIETATRINPFEVLFGLRPDDGTSRRTLRFGLKRAYGPAEHPIFLGFLLVMLMPWCGVVFSLFRRRLARITAIGVGLAGAAGIFATVSRGPVLVLIGMWVFERMIWYRWLRWATAAGTLAIIVWGVTQPDHFVATLERAAPPAKVNPKVAELDGERIEFYGTRQRLLLLKAYASPFRHAGLLGYGTKAMSGFPPNIPHLPRDAQTLESLKVVDNSYLLIGLRLGWLGTGILVFLLAVTIAAAIRLAGDRSLSGFCGSLAGMLAVLSLAMATVFLSYDFTLPLLWTCGLVSGLDSRRLEQMRGH